VGFGHGTDFFEDMKIRKNDFLENRRKAGGDIFAALVGLITIKCVKNFAPTNIFLGISFLFII
jgi:hypothetical protein